MKDVLKEMHSWMSGYMASFHTEDAEVQKGILIKETHTGYVTSNSVALAKHLGLSPHDTYLAEIIGLFHDVGRFRQYTLYKTFNDAQSEDHADIGLTVLEELPFFKRISPEDYSLVRFAIGNHNKKEIAPTQNPREILFAKIIRDADKLDIYRVLSPYLRQEDADKMPNFIKGKDRADISPDFADKFVAGEQVDYRLIRTNGDRKLVRLMWVYDVNFSWTLRRIREKGYIDKIIENLPMDEKVRLGVDRLLKYTEDKCRMEDSLPADFVSI